MLKLPCESSANQTIRPRLLDRNKYIPSATPVLQAVGMLLGGLARALVGKIWRWETQVIVVGAPVKILD